MGDAAEDRVLARRHYAYLDVLRCIAVYLVIGLHCIGDMLEDRALFATPTWWAMDLISGVVRMGVPLFFMISGYLHLTDPRTDNVGEFYRRRLGKLIPPFLVWDLIYFLYKCFTEGGWTINELGFVRELTGLGSQYHLWFVYQMAALYLLMPFLKKIVDHSSEKELLIFLGVILLQPTIFRLLNVVQTLAVFGPFLAIVEGYAGFLLVGYLLGTKELSPRVRRWIYILGLVGLVGGAWANFARSQPTNIRLYGNEGYFITHYMTSSACFVLAKQTAEKLPGWLKGAAGKLSGLTFGIYFAHVLVMDLIRMLLDQRGALFGQAAEAAVVFLTASLVTTLFIWLVSHVRGLRTLLM